MLEGVIEAKKEQSAKIAKDTEEFLAKGGVIQREDIKTRDLFLSEAMKDLILTQIKRGKSNKQISVKLGVHPDTVGKLRGSLTSAMYKTHKLNKGK